MEDGIFDLEDLRLDFSAQAKEIIRRKLADASFKSVEDLQRFAIRIMDTYGGFDFSVQDLPDVNSIHDYIRCVDDFMKSDGSFDVDYLCMQCEDYYNERLTGLLE